MATSKNPSRVIPKWMALEYIQTKNDELIRKIELSEANKEWLSEMEEQFDNIPQAVDIINTDNRSTPFIHLEIGKPPRPCTREECKQLNKQEK